MPHAVPLLFSLDRRLRSDCIADTGGIAIPMLCIACRADFCCPTDVATRLRISVIIIRSPGGASAGWLVSMTRTSPFGGSTVLLQLCLENTSVCTDSRCLFGPGANVAA